MDKKGHKKRSKWSHLAKEFSLQAKKKRKNQKFYRNTGTISIFWVIANSNIRNTKYCIIDHFGTTKMNVL